MKTSARWGLGAVAALALVLCGCASPATDPDASPTGTSTEVIAPVTRTANDLEGAAIELRVGQVLNIDTGDLAVDSYTAEVSDAAVAEFVPGYDDGSATFNPGLRALAPGTTEVEMLNTQGGIPPLRFTIEVTGR